MTSRTPASGLDASRLEALHARELSAFAAQHPKSHALLERGKRSMIRGVPMSWMQGLYRHPPMFIDRGEGPYFWDVDGKRYLDFNVVDLALTVGFGAAPIANAVAEAARRGAHFLLPIEESIAVTERLAVLTGVPFWQFTLSASGANVEVIRIARALTGRSRILLFKGHYHGHLDDALVERDGPNVVPALKGLLPDVARHVELISFNNIAAAEKALETGDFALALTEPALSNCTLVKPDPGYLMELHRLCGKHGTLLCLDEAHTFQFAHGGLKREWKLDCDLMVLGKGLGTGVPFGLHGMSERVAAFVEANADVDFGSVGLAMGGTTYANTLAVLAAKVALEQILIEPNYARVTALGEKLAAGLAGIFADLGLKWTALSLGPRSGYCLFPQAPRNGEEAIRSIDPSFVFARRIWMLNRGVWDAMASAGPQVSFSHDAEHVDEYLRLARSFLEEVMA